MADALRQAEPAAAAPYRKVRLAQPDLLAGARDVALRHQRVECDEQVEIDYRKIHGRSARSKRQLPRIIPASPGRLQQRRSA